MRVHAAPQLPFDTVIVVENGVVAIIGRVSELLFEPGDGDDTIDIYLPPEEVEYFIAKFCPRQSGNRRLN